MELDNADGIIYENELVVFTASKVQGLNSKTSRFLDITGLIPSEIPLRGQWLMEDAFPKSGYIPLGPEVNRKNG
jgi:hypothetical protein